MESWKTRLTRWAFNFFPAYRGGGARITYISHDFREVHVVLPLNWRTRNYVGTIYGGSMYSAVDPIYMVMLIKNLPKGTVVWDKAAAIRFKRPGREALYARFRLEQGEINAILAELERQPSLDRHYTVELVDRTGKVHAVVEKTIYIRRKDQPSEDGLQPPQAVSSE